MSHNHAPPSLRILVISSSYPRHNSDYAVPWMRKAHARIQQRGHHVTVLAPSFRGLRTHHIDGIEVKRFRYAPKSFESLTHEEGATYKVRQFWMQLWAIPYILCGCLAAARIAWRGGYDVIHVHWPFPHGMMGQVARAVSGAPLVIMSHGAEFALAARKKWIIPWLRQSLRAADLRIANSRDTASKVRQCCGKHCEVLPYGTTVDGVNVEAASNTVPRVLFTGRLIERKGVEYLLHAVPMILKHHDAKFVITGNGDQRPMLEELRDKLGLRQSVQFLGFVSNEQLRDEYARCDLWVNPAIVDSWGDAEGLGVGSIEAYNYRKPVVASAVGGIPDTVLDGITGFLVPEKDPEKLAEAIIQLLADPDKAKRMGKAGFNFARQTFGWGRITSTLLQLYRSALPGRTATVPALDPQRTDSTVRSAA